MFGLLFLIVIKSAFLILPSTVVWLAFRRLLLSKSANAWLYAATALFALATTIGLVPWASGVGTSHPIFFVFAAMTPAIWYGVAILCNSTRSVAYDSELERTLLRLKELMRAETSEQPLVLLAPHWPDTPTPVFRHRPSAEKITPAVPGDKPASRASEATLSLLRIARMMRGNTSSETRRIKLLPPPSPRNPVGGHALRSIDSF